MKALYKYPQSPFPYSDLARTNRERSRAESEYELIDTGIFNENRYFDIFIEYAKNDVDDILVRATVINRGPSPATLHLLPTVWFRNTWSWGYGTPRPELSRLDTNTIGIHEQSLGEFKLWLEDAPPCYSPKTKPIHCACGVSTAGSGIARTLFIAMWCRAA